MERCCQATTRFFLAGLLLTFLFGGCSVHENRYTAGLHHRSFIAYWPPPKSSQQLDLAIKDNIDVKGVVTTDGSEYVAKAGAPASQDAECLAIARRRNVLIVGKTNLSELSATPSGLARTTAAILLFRLVYPDRYRRALERRPEWEHALRHVFQTVDFIALPTVQARPPAIPWFGKRALLEARVLNMQNTVAVNFAGNPALAVPVPLRHEAFPVTSLQLVGPKFSESELLNAGRLVEAGIEKSKSVGLTKRISHLPPNHSQFHQ